MRWTAIRGSSFPTASDFRKISRQQRQQWLDTLNELTANRQLTPHQERIGRILATQFLNMKTGECFPSITTLAERTGCGRDTICTALALLIEKGMLEKTRRMKGTVTYAGRRLAQQMSNAYRLVVGSFRRVTREDIASSTEWNVIESDVPTRTLYARTSSGKPVETATQRAPAQAPEWLAELPPEVARHYRPASPGYAGDDLATVRWRHARAQDRAKHEAGIRLTSRGQDIMANGLSYETRFGYA